MQLVLASASPRRRELLRMLVSDFTCHPTDIDESVRPGERPEEYVMRLAVAKSMACEIGHAAVLSADTTVTVDSRILGKPSSRSEAAGMLRALSGREHLVMTGIALRSHSRMETRLVTTSVQFASLSEGLIQQYLDTEEPWDKAGAYGIQGFAGSFVRAISGSYSAVVGLPLCETRELLAQFGMTQQLPDDRVG